MTNGMSFYQRLKEQKNARRIEENVDSEAFDLGNLKLSFANNFHKAFEDKNQS